MNNNNKKPTSQDVAKLAGVSQSAVSRCFTKGASISSRTKLRVIEAAKKLGYKPQYFPPTCLYHQKIVDLLELFCPMLQIDIILKY